jgi:PAS domain S-box-containing protein
MGSGITKNIKMIDASSTKTIDTSSLKVIDEVDMRNLQKLRSSALIRDNCDEIFEEIATACTLYCDSDFKITKTINLKKIVGYSNEEIIGKSILMLMTPMVAKIHKMIFDKLLQDPDIDLVQINKRIQLSMDNVRIMNILTKTGEIIRCYLDVIIHENLSSITKLRIVDQISNPNCPAKYLKYINNVPEYHVDQYDNVVCIMMDLANSTEKTLSKLPEEISLLHHNIIKNITTTVEKYNPYVYIHEICGDSVFILVNAPFMHRHEQPFELAVNVSSEILNNLSSVLNKYDMFMRCGISSGEISAGVIDGKFFRVFGSVVNKAARLETACEKDFIEFDEELFVRLPLVLQNNTLQQYKILKGFGKMKTFSLSIK